MLCLFSWKHMAPEHRAFMCMGVLMRWCVDTMKCWCIGVLIRWCDDGDNAQHYYDKHIYDDSFSSKNMSGTHWSLVDLPKSRFSSVCIHGWRRMSSDRIRSSGSFRRSERIMQRAFDERHSGTWNWPREIFAKSDACSESLNGYLKWDKKSNG